MLLASEAAEKTRELIYTHKTEELMRIEEGIINEVNQGRFEYSYKGNISPEARTELERCGYEVTYGSQYNEHWVTIDWV